MGFYCSVILAGMPTQNIEYGGVVYGVFFILARSPRYLHMRWNRITVEAIRQTSVFFFTHFVSQG